MRVTNWDEWQSFRKDRGAPPWIKVYRNLLTNKKWALLTDQEKGQLVSLWIVAADSNGYLPDEPAVLRKICQLDEAPNVKKFIEYGLLELGCQVDANLTPNGCQGDAPETEERQRRAEESRGDADTPAGIDATSGHRGEDSPTVAGRYAFEGNVIKLTERDFNRWKASFGKLDVPAELEGLDSWLVDHPEKQKSWFNVVAGALAKKQRETPERPKRNIPLAKRELKEEAI